MGYNKKVKQSVNIPVIGNGDIIDEESALQMFEQTGVDGIMIEEEVLEIHGFLEI